MPCCAKPKEKVKKLDGNQPLDTARETTQTIQQPVAPAPTLQTNDDEIQRRQAEELLAEQRKRDAEALQRKLEKEKQDRDLQLQQQALPVTDEATKARNAAAKVLEEERKKTEFVQTVRTDQRPGDLITYETKQTVQPKYIVDEEKKPLLDTVVTPHKHEEKKKPFPWWCLQRLLCCLCLLLALLLCYLFCDDTRRAIGGMLGATYSSVGGAFQNARAFVSSSNNVGPGMIDVKSFKEIDEGQYKASRTIDENGRQEYLAGHNDCKISYNENGAYWAISCKGEERCKSFYDSKVPPTDGWECTNGETAPVLDLLNCVLVVTNEPGEECADGSYSQKGWRNDKFLYESEHECQISYSDERSAWENVCYNKAERNWDVLYCHPDKGKTPPTTGWISKYYSESAGCRATGLDPAPEFEYENLRASWDESATYGEWTRKEDQGSMRLPVGDEHKRSPPDLNRTEIVEKVASDAKAVPSSEPLPVEMPPEIPEEDMIMVPESKLKHQEGQICVKDGAHKASNGLKVYASYEGCYTENPSSYNNGRYEFDCPTTTCKFKYNLEKSLWEILCDSEEKCKNLLQSYFPPTQDWECTDPASRPEFQVKNLVYEVTTAGGAVSRLNTMIQPGTKFVEDGIRNKKTLYETKDGCQMSYDAQAWTVMCYEEATQSWYLLYKNKNTGDVPPAAGWTSVNGAPGPVFSSLAVESANYETARRLRGVANGSQQEPDQPAPARRLRGNYNFV